MKNKSKYKSRTYWLGMAMALGNGVLAVLPPLQAYISPVGYNIAMAIVGIAVVVLRFDTTGGIE